jgi:glycerophosphoryl diester phosphodiesterase
MTLVYAHRGASAAHPENTLLAFTCALAMGVAGIELDLHGSLDGVPVVIHDGDLARTTNGTGAVADTPLTTLRSLDAGRGDRIPTLGEVLALAGDRVHLDIEVKAPGIEHAVLAALADAPRARWAISSFDWDILCAFRRLSPAELWPLAEEWSADLVAVAHELDSAAVALFAGAYDETSATALAAAGLKVMVWTVNDVAEAKRVRRLGAFALCSDVPDLILAAFRDG